MKRNVNVVKYRKLLHNIQYFCTHAKWQLSREHRKNKGLTDFERGFISGKHAAYRDVLRKLEKMKVNAEFDWVHTQCREER